MIRNQTRYSLLALLLAAATAHAQTAVGEITGIDGYAEIDAFGSDQFIAARVGDTLYEESVIWSDFDTWVEIVVDGTSYEIAPNSTTSVRSFAADRRQRAGAGFFRRLIRGLSQALAPPEEEIVSGGTDRASEAPGAGPGGGFVLDVDADGEFEAGQEALERGDYREAVERFKRIEYPEDGSFPIEEYYVSATWALMGLGDFGEAIRTAFEVNLDEPSPQAVRSLGPRLQFLVALAAYYSNDDEIARAASLAYLENVSLGEADERAISIAILTQRETNASQARVLERRARTARPEVAWDELLGR